MKIIDIKKEKKNYILVFDNLELLTNEDTIIKYYLRKGLEISSDLIDKIKEDTNFYFSYELAIRYLEHHVCSKYKMKMYLTRKEIDEITCNKIIEQLESIKLLDDLSFSKRLIDYYIHLGYGEYYIKNKLFENYINNEISTSLMSNIDQNIYVEEIDRLILKRINNIKIDEKNINKIKKFLAQRGYSYDLINREVDKILYEN